MLNLSRLHRSSRLWTQPLLHFAYDKCRRPSCPPGNRPPPRRPPRADRRHRVAPGETEELIAAREERRDAAEASLDQLCSDASATSTPSSQDLDAKMQPLEKKLYDGSVRNPKELTDLQKEVDSSRPTRSDLDDQGLPLIEAIEAATARPLAAPKRAAAPSEV